MKLIFILAEKQISMKEVEVAAWNAKQYSTNRIPECKAFPTANTLNYRGKINSTKTGKPCVNWKGRNLSYSNAWNHNYCRTVKQIDKHVWCWTSIKPFKWEYCDVPLCKMFIKEYIENVAKVFNIEFDKIDGMVDSKQLLENEKFSDMFRVGYHMFLRLASSGDNIELFFESLVLHHPLDTILQVIFSLMQSSEKIYLKHDLTQEDIIKG